MAIAGKITFIRKLRLVCGVYLLALAAALAPAQGANTVDLSNPAFLAAGGATSIPIGHSEFCKTHAQECGLTTQLVDAHALTESNWRELLEVNAAMNAAITPVTDEELYRVAEFWTYPRKAGDCEDFALAKRRELINRGWPASTLLITVVKEANGNGHAVLLVRTDRGDLVLDNQDGLVRLWNETRYQFIKRQSQGHSGQWVDVIDTRPMSLIASL